MEVHPGMSYYNDIQDGRALMIKTLESTNNMTPLHFPPGPPLLPERYEELRKTYQLCKPVFKTGQELGGSEPMLPESHRIYEPPYKFNHEPFYDEDTRNAPLRLPDLPENANSYQKYLKYKTPGTLLIAGRYRPFHPYIHANIDIKGGPERKEDNNEPVIINREDMAPSEQQGFFRAYTGIGINGKDRVLQPLFDEGNSQRFEAPKSTVKPPEPDLSSQVANMLENVKAALWLSTYKRDYTGKGSMNPLLLDDYNAKMIGRVTGELGKDVEVRESFQSSTTQVRPLEGRIARFLQGRPYIPHLQHQHSTENHRSLHWRDNSNITTRYLEEMENGEKASLCPVQQYTENKASERNRYLIHSWIQPKVAYQEKNSQDEKLTPNRFRKITDTWKIDQLYQRQLAVPPDREPPLKTADSIYYEDLQPSHFNRYIVWHNPIILSKPTSTHRKLEICVSKPDLRCASKPDLQCISNQKETVTSSSFPEWIPNSGVARPQTKLLDIQDSFTKGEAIKYLNDLTRRGLRNLRDHDRQGRRHKFQGIHACFL